MLLEEPLDDQRGSFSDSRWEEFRLLRSTVFFFKFGNRLYQNWMCAGCCQRVELKNSTDKLYVSVLGKFPVQWELSPGWPVVIEGSSVAITDAYVHGFVSFQSSVFHSRSALSTRMESSWAASPVSGRHRVPSKPSLQKRTRSARKVCTEIIWISIQDIQTILFIPCCSDPNSQLCGSDT